MDSLFDASEFDVVAEEPVVAPPVVGVGQLDIFGNVVEEVPAASAAAVGEELAPSSELESVVDEDDDADTRSDSVGNAGSEDDDPGDALNDPNWEPPIDDLIPAEEMASSHERSTTVASSNAFEHDDNVEREPSVDSLWQGIVGQDAAVSLLRSAALAPVHAYLFVGPPGSGRRAAARAFAASLLCRRGGCGSCGTCSRASAALHPDLTEIEREGASISVDQAREIIRVAMRSPIEGERKVIVLIDFHLVANAAATLLKIIEEPPPSTVFVVLADQLSNDLVTIASRCVEVRFVALPRAVIVDTLIAEGVERERAVRVATASGGRLDRARLLVHDEHFGERLSFWEMVPKRLDGTGAAVAVMAAEAITRIDEAGTEPLAARHREELEMLDDRIETTGMRGGAGLRKELVERQKRELKRLRDDELRFGLGVLQQVYRAELIAGESAGSNASSRARSAAEAIGAISGLVAELDRNPNVTLALTSLFLRLPPLQSRVV